MLLQFADAVYSWQRVGSYRIGLSGRRQIEHHAGNASAGSRHRNRSHSAGIDCVGPGNRQAVGAPGLADVLQAEEIAISICHKLDEEGNSRFADLRSREGMVAS